MMLKNFLALIIVTLVIFLTAHYFYLGLHGLLYLHALILHSLSHIFTYGKIAELVRNILAILAIPLAGGLIAGGVLLAFKRDKKRSVLTIVWAIWLILITVLVLRHK